MNILFIHQHFYPEESGTAKSCTEMARYFASRNHDVTVITEFPNRNFESVTDSKNELKQVDVYKGITIHRLKNKFQYSSNKVSRISAYLMFAFTSFLHALKLKNNFDICITIQALPSAIPCVLLQKLNKTPHHFYCTDMMPDLGIASGMVNNKFIIKLSRIVEKLVYDNSTAVYAVTPLMAENIKEKSSNKNIFVLPDWVDVKFFNENRYKYISYLENKYDLNGKKVILYIGNIGFLQNLRTVIDVAKRMDGDEEYNEYIFVIGGAGAQKAELENECKKHGLKNIRFIGVVDRQHVPSFLELSSCTLMNFADHPHMALYRSSKIFDYIMAEKPVIVGAIGELAKIVKENNLGVVARPSDPEDFYNKLIKLINTKYEINNEHLIKKYSRDNVLSELYKRIQCSNE